MQPRIYELDNVNVDIRENHARALRAAHIRALREANPRHQRSLLIQMERALGMFLITAGQHLAPQQAPAQTSVQNPAAS